MKRPRITPRTAHGVDAVAKARNLSRLRRIEGQVRGLQKMVQEDRYCADILVQISAVHEALRGVGRELMRNHLRHCATAALRGTEAQATSMHDEILALMYKHVR
jgi:DNA-binding FrmR family transcriptional regulator